MPKGEQGSKPEEMAHEGGEPGLFSWFSEREARATMAQGPSGLLAAQTS